MSALVNRLSMSLVELRDQYEASTSRVAAFIGSIIGMLVTLTIVATIGMLIGRSYPWVSFVLAVIVSIATFYTVLEVFLAMSMYKQSAGEPLRHIIRYIVISKVIELIFFLIAVLILFHVV